MAGSHRYATAGEYWATITIYDARPWDRSVVATPYVNVVHADNPGPGGGWDGDLLAALDAIHGDPWKERQSDYTAFEVLPV